MHEAVKCDMLLSLAGLPPPHRPSKQVVNAACGRADRLVILLVVFYAVMNVSLKSKKRVVLPSRPSPPSVDRILEDVSGAEPDDPVFAILQPQQQQQQQTQPGEAERTFRQCRRHADVTRQLQEVESLLTRQRDQLRAAGQQLDRKVAEVKG
ncbi:UPF0449 protein C19orf25 homolog isoform X4 [Vanacampus margaritifer]